MGISFADRVRVPTSTGRDSGRSAADRRMGPPTCVSVQHAAQGRPRSRPRPRPRCHLSGRRWMLRQSSCTPDTSCCKPGAPARTGTATGVLTCMPSVVSLPGERASDRTRSWPGVAQAPRAGPASSHAPAAPSRPRPASPLMAAPSRRAARSPPIAARARRDETSPAARSSRCAAPIASSSAAGAGHPPRRCRPIH